MSARKAKKASLDHRFELRLTRAERDMVTAIANEDGRTVSNMIRKLIRDAAARREMSG